MRLAMAVDGHYRKNEVVPRHFLQAAKAAVFGVVLAEEVLPDIAAELEPALDKTFADLPDGFPQPLAEAIAAGIRRRAIAFHAV
jgi:serine/threonine-protein kinase HipA